MAKSEIELINRALVKIGSNPIQGLEENSAESIVVKDVYYGVRDSMLSAYPWTFCKRKAALTMIVEKTIDGKNMFAFPSDMLRLLSVNTDDYEVSSGTIASRSESIIINYLHRPVEMDFPAYFDAVMVARLASEICLPLTDSTSRTEFLISVAEKEFRDARLIDTGQNITGHIVMDALTQVR